MATGIHFTNHDRYVYTLRHIFDRVCREHQIRPPWTNGQVERIPLTICRQTGAGQRNRTFKEATVKRMLYDDHQTLRNHPAILISADTFGQRLNTLMGLTPYEGASNQSTIEPERFTSNPVYQLSGLHRSDLFT